MKTLSAKLSVALLVIVTLMGGALYWVDRANTQAYYEELSQKLNAPIAMYVTGQRQLINNGQPDVQALQELSGHAMVINPTAEIYLLDTDGLILGHALAPEQVERRRVGLEPIRSLIAGAANFPLHGDDPRGVTKRKIFSAAEVRSDDGLEGYLYVVLGGETYEQLAKNISGSYVGRISAIAFLVIALFAAVVGILAFHLLTRRLKRLNAEVERVAAAEFEVLPNIDAKAQGGDEIDKLTGAFSAMSQQIQRQISQLRENDRLRRELVSNISHDLRTPLAAMQGYIETLIIRSDGMSSEERDQYLTIARKHAVRLGQLIGDLFELSKLDSANVVPTLETFSLSELVQDVAQEFTLDAQHKGIELDIQLSPDRTNTVGDIGLIQRVLENLVRNAVQFTPAGGAVTVTLDKRPQSVTVAVADNGPGIPDEHLPHIFDRFYRSVDGQEAAANSSGLGLAIVKRILDLHQSRITVESNVDHGTRFEFELPLSQAAA